MSDFLTRLKTEQSELTEKIEKLSVFVNGDKFNTLSSKHQYLLKRQLVAMEQYNECLELRLEDLNN